MGGRHRRLTLRITNGSSHKAPSVVSFCVMPGYISVLGLGVTGEAAASEASKGEDKKRQGLAAFGSSGALWQSFLLRPQPGPDFSSPVDRNWIRMGLPVARLGLLSAAAVLLLRGGCAGSSHSLRIFYTLFTGSDQDAPQYIVVGYVDDQLASRFDPPTRRMLPQVPWLHNVRKEDLHFWDFISQRVSSTERRFKSDLAILHRYHNSSKGFHSWQRMIGCELSEDGHKQGHFQYGYDGENFISLDQKTLTWTAADVRAQVTKRRWEAEPFITQNTNNFLEKECIQLLQKCMTYGTESLLRKEPPVVKVTRRTQYNSMEILICQLYGFYPKEMDVTWRKDGEVWEQDTFRGGILPNSDGTYHAWLSIEVDPKERDRYRCYVDHIGFPEPLILAWEEPAFVSNFGFIAGVIGLVVAAALIAAGVSVYIKKRSRNAYRTALTTSRNIEIPRVN